MSHSNDIISINSLAESHVYIGHGSSGIESLGKAWSSFSR